MMIVVTMDYALQILKIYLTLGLFSLNIKTIIKKKISGIKKLPIVKLLRNDSLLTL